MPDFLRLANRRTTRPTASTRSELVGTNATREIMPRGNAENAELSMTAPFKSRCAQLLFGKMRHNLFGRWRSDPRDQGLKVRPHTLSGP